MSYKSTGRLSPKKLHELERRNGQMFADHFGRSLTVLVKKNFINFDGGFWFSWPESSLTLPFDTSFRLNHSFRWQPGEREKESPLVVAKGDLDNMAIAWRDFKHEPDRRRSERQFVPFLQEHFQAMGWRSEIAQTEHEFHLIFDVLDPNKEYRPIPLL